jgi:hypothetical protein
MKVEEFSVEQWGSNNIINQKALACVGGRLLKINK